MKEINEEMQELTPIQRRAGNITAGAFVAMCGLFLLLCGLSIIPIAVTKVIVGSLLFTIALVLLATGIIQRNSVSIWLGFAFVVPALVELLNKTLGLGYSQLYPLYIAIPAVASLFTMLFTRQFLGHLKVIIFFGIIAGIFTLNACGIGWSIVLPILVIYVGLLIIYFAIKVKRDKEKENDNEY